MTTDTLDGAVAAPAPPAKLAWKVAIIDDGFIPPVLERLPEELREAVGAVLVDPAHAGELAALGIKETDGPDAMLDALTDPNAPLGEVYVALAAISTDLQGIIEERQELRRLVVLIQEEAGSDVRVCRPDEELPDLTDRDLVLIDYYLEGSSGTANLSKEFARRVRAQPGRSKDQQVVLMSSIESVRAHRNEFRKETDLAGAAFAFIGKADLNQRWKVKAHLGMLQRARPHAPVLATYRETLRKSLEEATSGLLQLSDDLDIGDYAFLQSQALMSDGHPLGDYVSWLLASHFVALAFERGKLREDQRKVDELEFEQKTFAPTEPSPVVAQLFHSALLTSNVGPLERHPRAKPNSAYAAFPMVQLGDVFLDEARTKAVVILSADCDLAFSPTEQRPPNGDTPIMMAPGKPVALTSGGAGDTAVTHGHLFGDNVYRIDWNFKEYRSIPLAKLADYLKELGLNVANRDRLRPLYALKLQQEFGAHLMRVGPPIMPPLTYEAEGRVYDNFGGVKNLGEEFIQGEVMLSHHQDETRVRMTPKLVDALQRAAQTLVQKMIDAKPAPQPGKPDHEQTKIDALQKEIDNDDFWIGLVEGVTLNGFNSMKAIGTGCSFIRGEWSATGKPRVIFEVSEKRAAGTANS
ncbi:hypothetical protein [Xanthobacter sp. VNH20]|uniref:hypothetical protein n=1 Tax=Xanthobacter TaxID=279 RepID=UPI0032B4E62E